LLFPAFWGGVLSGVLALFVLVVFFKSIYSVGPTQVGLVEQKGVRATAVQRGVFQPELHNGS
jgi:regulator of protease activity HflC (stomatin/prohibitin superfamily)